MIWSSSSCRRTQTGAGRVIHPLIRIRNLVLALKAHFNALNTVSSHIPSVLQSQQRLELGIIFTSKLHHTGSYNAEGLYWRRSVYSRGRRLASFSCSFQTLKVCPGNDHMMRGTRMEPVGTAPLPADPRTADLVYESLWASIIKAPALVIHTIWRLPTDLTFSFLFWLGQ